MAIQTRSVLKPFFATGQRPKEQHFHDWLDSFYHKTEDPINLSGWEFRSFFKDLRAEGAAITNGGLTMVEIPFSVSRVKRIRVFGNGQRTNPLLALTITVTLIYVSDILIPALNGAPNDIPQVPVSGGFFRHILIGPPTPTNFVITVPPAPTGGFSGELVFPGTGLDLGFTDFRFFRLNIVATSNITFPIAATSFLYYGFQYE